MPESFCILWASDRVREARRLEGQSIPFLFGGPHTSHPLLSRYSISPGDVVYPIGVKGGRISVLCEVIIERIIPLDAFLAQQSIPRQKLTATDDLQAWLAERDMRFLAPTCTDEAALLRSAKPLEFDRTIPPAALADVRFVNRSGAERLLGGVEDGRLKSSTNLQGHYLRLADETARLFRAVATGEV